MKKAEALKPVKSRKQPWEGDYLAPGQTDYLEYQTQNKEAEAFAAGFLEASGGDQGDIFIRNGIYIVIYHDRKLGKRVRKITEAQALTLAVKLISRGKLRKMLLERIAK